MADDESATAPDPAEMPPITVPAPTEEQLAQLRQTLATMADALAQFFNALAPALVETGKQMAAFTEAWKQAEQQAAARPAWQSPYGPPHKRQRGW